MNIVITGRHFDVTDGIKAHAGEKIAKLDKFLTKLLEAHVILSLEKFRHIAEITVLGKNLKVTATETTSDMYASIDKAIDSLEKQLKKYHDKLKEHRGKMAHKVEDEAVKAASISANSPAASFTKIVETKRLVEKPMSTEEAAEELELSNSEFLVFRNSDEDKINVIYKRKDGNFGLIKT